MRLNGYDLYHFQKTYYMHPLFQLLFWKRKLPIGFLRYLLDLLKVSIVPLKKCTVDKLLQYYHDNFGQVNVKWESRNNKRVTNNHWRCSKEVGFPEIALSKDIFVKIHKSYTCNFTKNCILSEAFLKEINHIFLSKNF